jgi:pimeloyl-ACP methyl ester carboxylesterase
MKRRTCNGVSINNRCVGRGPDVVLIHGLATNHAFWHIHVLLSLAKDYRVTVYDLRGHGYSGMPPSQYTSADMAEDLHELLDHLEIPKAHLIGHSFGGAIALHYAVVHPERVSSLTIADARIRALQPASGTQAWSIPEEALKKLQDVGLVLPEDETEPGLWILEQLASPRWQEMRYKLKGTPLFIPFGGWNGGHRTAARWIELLRSTTARQDFISVAGLTRERLLTVQHPTLAIYGEKSPVLPSLQGLQEVLPSMEAIVVPEAGHYFPLTQPQLFADLVGGFLGAGAARRPELRLCGGV